MLKSLIAVPLIIFFFSCQDSKYINTDQYTYYDDISDITYLNGSFFTTNYDLSGNAGNQIDLISFSLNENGSFIDDSFHLDINGQGYLSITNDGSDIYMQSRSTQLLFKFSSVGEIAYARYDSIDTKWMPSGISYHSSSDSLIMLYRNIHKNSEYRLRLLSKDIDQSSNKDVSFEVLDIDTTNHGIYSLSYFDSVLYMLAVRDNEDVLITMNYEDLSIISTEMIGDSTVVGIAIHNNSIYFSYRDRRIQKFKDL